MERKAFPCVKKVLNKGAWTPLEDRILTDYINLHGEGKWRTLPIKAGLNRCGKSCRLRWLNYLRPDIKRGNITPDEEDMIIRLHNLLGNRLSLIACRLPGRTDNEIKNYWNSNIRKKVLQGARSSLSLPYKPIQRRSRGRSRRSRTSPVHVVHTKATRFATAIIPDDLQNHDHENHGNNHDEPFKLAENNNIMDNIGVMWSPVLDLLGPTWAPEKIPSSRLKVDESFDEQHFSSTLEAQLPHVPNSQNDFHVDQRQTGGDLTVTPTRHSSHERLWQANDEGDIDVDWIANFLLTEFDQS